MSRCFLGGLFKHVSKKQSQNGERRQLPPSGSSFWCFGQGPNWSHSLLGCLRYGFGAAPLEPGKRVSEFARLQLAKNLYASKERSFRRRGIGVPFNNENWTSFLCNSTFSLISRIIKPTHSQWTPIKKKKETGKNGDN